MSEAYLGEIRLFALNFVPAGWMICHGQELTIRQYTALYALIGIAYGGDGQTKFNIPDLRGRVPMQIGTSSFGTFDMGDKGGMESIPVIGAGTATITSIDQLPAHTHTASIKVSNDAGAATGPSEGAYLGAIKSATAAAAPNLYVTTAAATSTLNAATATIGSAGAAKPNPISVTTKAEIAPVLPPYLGMFYAICTDGIFPNRP